MAEPSVREQSIKPTGNPEGVSREDAVNKAFPEGYVKPGDEPKPDAVKPDEVKPDAVKPDEPKPDAVKPDEVKPDAVKPEEVKPDEPKKKGLLDRLSDKEEDSKPDEDDVWKEPDNLDEKGRVDFRGLKASRDKEVGELKAKLEAAEKLGSDPEMERLKQENVALSQRLKEIDFQATPEFEKTFIKPREDAMRNLVSMAKEHGLEVSVEELLGKKGKALGDAVSEATDSLPDFYRSEFMDGVRKVLDIDRAKGAALQDAGKYREGLYQQRRQTQEAALDSVFSRVAGDHGNLISPLEGDSPEDRAYNEAALGLKAKVRAYTSENMSEEGIAEVSTKATLFDFMVAHAFPSMERDYKELLTSNAEKDKKIAAFRGQNPKLDAGGGEVKTAPKSREQLVDKIFGP